MSAQSTTALRMLHFRVRRPMAQGFRLTTARNGTGDGEVCGLRFLSALGFPVGGRTAFIENRLISNWPQSLVGFYEAADLFYCSRLVTAMKRTIVPIFCKEWRLRAAPPIRETADSTRSFRCTG
ncbi:hypothetical protein CUJ84_Chr003792 [Rhizobium leguminosarum]|uniref:Uncharacterized protein n=1 Tax=Rhizobium leguminosarum TaxID=384 RepID=A0A2K9Z7B3_RHILE|nr:hypothetical protein CUJ84_Chr003792 [Rhizobium leguminosarum]